MNPAGNREILGPGKDDKGFVWIGCTDGSLFSLKPSSESFELLSDGQTFTTPIEEVGTQLNPPVKPGVYIKASTGSAN